MTSGFTDLTGLSDHECGAALLAGDPYLGYDFGDEHPLTARRLTVGVDLLRTAGLLTDSDCFVPPAATPAELQLVHAAAYVEAVERLSQWAPLMEQPLETEARRYGLGQGDNPIFPGAHDAAALIAGGSLHAVRAIMAGVYWCLTSNTAGSGASQSSRGAVDTQGQRVLPLPAHVPLVHVFHPMGGLHHALPGRASGFCIYNDPAVAIAAVVQEHEARVLYVDLDVHHGDGVQLAFEDDPRVLTVSFHESGQFLFPGTGDVLDLGTGAGRGYSVNLPVQPGTTDASWMACLEALLPALADRFHPDLIVSQHGCDTHAWDPLADIALTTATLEAQAQLLHRLAHEHCGGRWLALGGGGYDVYRVVPRAWALLWAVMAGRPVPLETPPAWRARWQPECRQPLPILMRDVSRGTIPETGGGAADPTAASTVGPTAASTIGPTSGPNRDTDGALPAAVRAAAANERTLQRVRRLVLPVPYRHAYPLPALRAQAVGAAVPGIVRLTGAMPETRTGRLETARGAVLLRNLCPPSLLARLHADAGLVAFTGEPGREHALLLRAAAHPDTCMAVAHTPEGAIVSEVTICAPEGRWAAVDGLLELALETSRDWRRLGLASALLDVTLGASWVEQVILLAEGYYWHWDIAGSGLDAFGYRRALAALLGSFGFHEEATDEPDIASSPANILLARVGSHVSEATGAAFRQRLFRG